MPILRIEIVREGSQPQEPGLAASLADGLAPLFGDDPERTWVKLAYIEPGHYAEGGGGPKAGVQPVFISLLMARLPELEERERLAAKIARVVGKLMGRPAENVHLVFEAEAIGRVAFGGSLVL